jgi:hypothetical protein
VLCHLTTSIQYAGSCTHPHLPLTHPPTPLPPSLLVTSQVREGVVVFLGTLARHLPPTDPKRTNIVETLVSVLDTPSEAVQVGGTLSQQLVWGYMQHSFCAAWFWVPEVGRWASQSVRLGLGGREGPAVYRHHEFKVAVMFVSATPLVSHST